ncbi:Sugar phosphate isomerase/epimerase [Rhizobiales bacterium GAS188]|nr:Sugar phosphate isomerase/epimerase [Rhizobiales bacterium GAS188]
MPSDKEHLMRPLDGLSFQLYSARKLEPLESQFELLAGLGYKRVEPFGGLLGDPARLKTLLDRHGMTAPSCHVGMDRLRADVKAAVKICKDLGVATIFAPAPLIGERDGGEAEWRALGKELAGIGKAVNAEGLVFGWHNHHWEYGKAADGRTYLDVMFAEAPDLAWQADLAWIKRGGGDPADELKRHKNRVISCHIKDIAPAGQCLDEDGWADPGHGVLDWTALLPVMKEVGVKLFVAEHDNPNDVARFARRAAETISHWA